LKLLAPTVLAKLDKNFKEPPAVSLEKDTSAEGKLRPTGLSSSQAPVAPVAQ